MKAVVVDPQQMDSTELECITLAETFVKKNKGIFGLIIYWSLTCTGLNLATTNSICRLRDSYILCNVLAVSHPHLLNMSISIESSTACVLLFTSILAAVRQALISWNDCLVKAFGADQWISQEGVKPLLSMTNIPWCCLQGMLVCQWYLCERMSFWNLWSLT